MFKTNWRLRSENFIRLGLSISLSLLLFGQSVMAANLHDGLISYWSLDDGTGVTAADTFGIESDDGSLRNSPTWLGAADAAVGTSALRFNGLDQDVLISDSFDLDITTNAVTLAAWVNMDTLPSDLGESFGGIYDSAIDSYIMYLDRGNQELRFKVTDDDGTAERPGVPQSLLDTGNWHHVMGVYDGSEGAAKIYFDGERLDLHLNGGLVDPVRPGQIASIGANPLTDAGNPSQYFFPGAIDDVGVWNRALGKAEANYLYNAGNGIAVGAANPDIAFVPDETVIPVAPSVDPVIHYRFEGNFNNDGSGGSALNGTLIDTPGVNDNPFGPGSIGLGLDLRENPDAATGGDGVSVAYELPDNGTIIFDYAVDKYYNFQSLWTNSVDPNDWEMWIYDDGRLRGRVQSDSFAEVDLDVLGGLDNTYNIAFTWERDGDNVAVKLYVDGELRSQDEGSWVPHPDSTFYIAGGDGGNDFGAGIWDEFQIYNQALSAGEVLYLSQIPEPSSVLLVVIGILGLVASNRKRG